MAALSPPPVRAVSRVVFVCTHNSARSQLATALWAQRSMVPVASAGTRPAARVHPRAVRVATPPRTEDQRRQDRPRLRRRCRPTTSSSRCATTRTKTYPPTPNRPCTGRFRIRPASTPTPPSNPHSPTSPPASTGSPRSSSRETHHDRSRLASPRGPLRRPATCAEHLRGAPGRRVRWHLRPRNHRAIPALQLRPVRRRRAPCRTSCR